jgi:hypothetical protein
MSSIDISSIASGEAKELLTGSLTSIRRIPCPVAAICSRNALRFSRAHLELSGELECPETNTARQYTRYWSDDEKDLTDEKTSSSVKQSVVELPD